MAKNRVLMVNSDLDWWPAEECTLVTVTKKQFHLLEQGEDLQGIGETRVRSISELHTKVSYMREALPYQVFRDTNIDLQTPEDSWQLVIISPEALVESARKELNRRRIVLARDQGGWLVSPRATDEDDSEGVPTSKPNLRAARNFVRRGGMLVLVPLGVEKIPNFLVVASLGGSTP